MSRIWPIHRTSLQLELPWIGTGSLGFAACPGAASKPFFLSTKPLGTTTAALTLSFNPFQLLGTPWSQLGLGWQLCPMGRGSTTTSMGSKVTTEWWLDPPFRVRSTFISSPKAKLSWRPGILLASFKIFMENFERSSFWTSLEQILIYFHFSMKKSTH